MAGKCQAPSGEKVVVSEDRVGFFPCGTRIAGRDDTQETGVKRVHLAQAEPSFQRKLCLRCLWGLVCTNSQVRGWSLFKTRQILNFLRESNLISPEAGAFLCNWGDAKQSGNEAQLSPIPHDGLGHQSTHESPSLCPLCLGILCYTQRL